MNKHYSDEVDRGGLSREEVGKILGVSQTTVRQIEIIALRKLKASKKLYEYAKEGCGITAYDGYLDSSITAFF